MMGWTLVLLTQMVTVYFWYLAKIDNPVASVAQAGTQIMALLGIMALVFTYILAVRSRVIEKLFGGLDIVYKTHHILGGLALVFLINHALLLIVGAMPANMIAYYLLPGTSWAYTLGIIALYLMLFLIILTLYVKLPYRFWKWSHEWMGMVIILGGLHSMLISSDTSRYLPLRYWIFSWSLVATLAFLYKRFAYYFVGMKSYRIVRSGRDKDLLVVSMESADEPIDFQPGQFGFFSLPNKKRDDHAFSILGIEGTKLIIGIKVVGHFTGLLAELKAGSNILVRGPYGTFGQKMKNAKHAVWVAGGIGITPFLSMAKAVKNDQRVEMYFCARVLPPAVITTPFANLATRNPRFVWLPCETNKGGRITGRKIYDDTGCDRNAHYMLCGPKEMMESLAEQFAELGIRRSHIIYEDFAFK
ncbi:MAG: ferric reductase-like transmembrane domain-containing protein [Microgenomates group bacterium]